MVFPDGAPEDAASEDMQWKAIMGHMGPRFEKLLDKLYTKNLPRLKEFVILVRLLSASPRFGVS